MDQKQYETALADLETSLERLKALYEQWFQGIERIEPTVPRKNLERALAVLRREPQRNTGLRFRFQQLIQRYISYTTYWQRVARQIEEGTYRRDLMRARRHREAARKQRELDRLERRTRRDRLEPKSPEVEVAALGVEEEIDAALGALFRSDGSLRPRATPPVSTVGRGDASAESAMRSHEPALEGELGMQVDAAVGALFRGERSLRPTGQLSSLPPPGSSHPPARRSLSPFSTPSSMPPRHPTTGRLDRPQAGQPVASADSALTAASSGPGMPKAPAVPAEARPAAEDAHGRAVASALFPGSAGPTPVPSIPTPRLSGRPRVAGQPPPLPKGMPATRAAHNADPRPPAPPAIASSPHASRQPAGGAGGGAGAAIPRADPVRQAAAKSRAGTASAEGTVSEQQIRRIYDKYLEARRKNHERTDNVTLNGLAKSVRAIMPRLKEKHPGKRIDFEVVVKDGRVALKPVAR